MPAPPAVMIQGSGSDVGKSLIVAGLCRLFARRGLSVRPFKPQNMSNNAAVTPEGGEIGRAQALQAMAARIPPNVHMNPVLLKPEPEGRCQIVVQGQRLGTFRAGGFGARKAELLPRVMESFHALARKADLILVEGAGSAAEVNLRAGDIANMGFAEAARVPVILVGDIERGGLIANLVGTHALLGESERALVQGFIVNKFRGDPRLFDGGLHVIAERTGWESLGVVPWFEGANRLPAEDALALQQAMPRKKSAKLKIAVPVLPGIANFDDLDPLRLEEQVDIVLVKGGSPLPRDADLILLPGSKATTSDLAYLRAEGWDIDIAAHVRQGGAVLGICGGFQMLGRRIADPHGMEGGPQCVEGLGMLDVETVLTREKSVRPVSGRELESGLPVEGYEIHLGDTTGRDTRKPWLRIDGRPDGAMSRDGRVRGTYVHGIFGSDGFRAAFLSRLASGMGSSVNYQDVVETTLDELADHLSRHLDTGRILEIARSRVA